MTEFPESLNSNQRCPKCGDKDIQYDYFSSVWILWVRNEDIVIKFCPHCGFELPVVEEKYEENKTNSE